MQVESYRGTSKDLISKFLAEAQAKRDLMDVAESSLPLLMLMQALKLIQPFTNPHIARLIPDAREEAGRGAVYWGTVRESYIGFAYNKNKLPANAVPKNYDGLLNPALKGRMSFVTTDTGTRTVGGMLLAKGEEYLKRLRGQDITMHSVSGQALNDMIIGGEVEASPTIFRNHALVAQKKRRWCGCRWISCRPCSAARRCHCKRPIPTWPRYLSIFSLVRTARNTRSLRLRQPGEEYGFKRWYAEKGMSIQQLEKELDKWERGLRDLGRRQGRRVQNVQAVQALRSV